MSVQQGGKKKEKKESVQNSYYATIVPRIDKIYNMNFPINTDRKLIVLPNQEALGFRYDCYDSQICKDKISEQDFNKIVKQCTLNCEKLWMKKKLEETQDYNAPLKKVLYSAIVLSMIAFILLLILIYGICNNYTTEKQPTMTIRKYESCDSDGLLWTSVGLLILAGSMAVFVVVAGLMTDPKFIDLDKAIYRDLVNYLNCENLKNPNVKWEVQEEYFYLTLNIL